MRSTQDLLTNETVAAYMRRFREMQKYKYTKKGDELFIEKRVAVSEQINNLHVQAKINEFVVDNDGAKEVGGSSKGPCPMECLLAALANCLEQTALLYFTFQGVRIKSVKVRVEASQDKRSALNPRESPFPGFFDFKIIWYIDSDEDPKKIKRVLRRVEDNCPVKGTVSRPSSFSEEINTI